MEPQLKQQVEDTLKQNRIVLFMKGNRAFPRCGFSARVVDLLERHQAEFYVVDVLGNDELRSYLKEYSQWPTFPQLYVEGQLVGGCDIVSELDQTGELPRLLGQSPSS